MSEMYESLKMFVKYCRDTDWILPGHGTNGLWADVKLHNPYFKNI
jgi:hypothetical protein